MVLPVCADTLEGRAPLLFLLSFLGLATPLGVSGAWDGGGDGKRKDPVLGRRKENFLARARL